MSYLTTCRKCSVAYISADIYVGYPDGAPHCPVCYVEWLRLNNLPVPDTLISRANAVKGGDPNLYRTENGCRSSVQECEFCEREHDPETSNCYNTR